MTPLAWAMARFPAVSRANTNARGHDRAERVLAARAGQGDRVDRRRRFGSNWASTAGILHRRLEQLQRRGLPGAQRQLRVPGARDLCLWPQRLLLVRSDPDKRTVGLGWWASTTLRNHQRPDGHYAGWNLHLDCEPERCTGTYTYSWQYRDAFNQNCVGAGSGQSVSKSVSASTASWFDYQVTVSSGVQSPQPSVHVISELGQCNPRC